MTFLSNDPLRPGRNADDRATEGATLVDAGEARSAAARTFGGERFGSQQGPTPPDKCENVLAAGATWQGTLTVDSSVRVDGKFSGEIQSHGTVHVADGAFVDAKINAAFVVVAGSFQGAILCEQRVDLLARGRVAGEVVTKALTIQEGAILDATVQMSENGAPRLASRGGGRRATQSAEADRNQNGFRPVAEPSEEA
jgi:cytoskeletal protein CcmA (bactofilin family)